MSPESEKHIHIISFDIPYPADYGGVIDVYYKVKALNKKGIKVHLHCFEYGRKHSEKLEEICYSVNYYPRKKSLLHLFKSIPYIVSSRSCNKLFEELQKDSYPILYEGLHTTALLQKLSNRLNIVRMHNIEHDYYFQLSKSTSNALKKWYYKTESAKLRKYENILNKANHVLAISQLETEELSKKYENVIYVPAFHPNDQISSLIGKGSYIIYHGNLSVEENEKAALFLIQNVFSKLNIPCIIAGKNPTKGILKNAEKYKHIEIVANPDKHTMKELIQEAHINDLPTFQATGIKLKLLESIAIGRFCLVNSPMVHYTGLENLTQIKNSPEDIIKSIEELMDAEFTKDEINSRSNIWKSQFSNNVTVNKILNLI